MPRKTPFIPLWERHYYNAAEVGMLNGGISRATLYNLMKAGKLPSVRIRGRRLFPRETAKIEPDSVD